MPRVNRPMNAAAPEGLLALQTRFQAHVLHGDEAALADVRVRGSQGGPAARQRLGIYHHAYRARLLETLRDSVGHTLRYLGDTWFDALATEHIEATESLHPNLRFHGEGLADWLSLRLADPESPVGLHPEVAELARLDWALRHAFDAAEAPALSREDLAAIAPSDWATVGWALQPSASLLCCQVNTLVLWHALDQDTEPPAVQALASPQHVLVWRLGERPHFRSLGAAEHLALAGLQRGRCFAEVCADLAEAWPGQDTATLAGRCLRQWVEEGVLQRDPV
jgi:hypothetical protein